VKPGQGQADTHLDGVNQMLGLSPEFYEFSHTYTLGRPLAWPPSWPVFFAVPLTVFTPS